MIATDLLVMRCCQCGEARPIVKTESVIRYGKPVTLLYCVTCSFSSAPEPTEQVTPQVPGYLSLKQIAARKTTPQGLVLDAIRQGAETSSEINNAIADLFGSYLPKERLSEALRVLVRQEALEQFPRLGQDTRYRVPQRTGGRKS